MVASYWEIGRIIIEEEQKGKARAEYGEYILVNLAKKLTKDFGKGFDESNLRYIRKFYMVFPIRDAVRHELSWTHYRLLLKVEKPDARSFYETECVNSRWSTRELERQISSLLFERLALSRDKKGVMKLAAKGHEIQKPEDLVKDPYILEFAGIRQDERFQERELEQALIDKLQHFLLELGKGFSLRKMRLWSNILFLKARNGYSLHGISFICLQKKNWRRNLSKNGRLLKWNASCKGNR